MKLRLSVFWCGLALIVCLGAIPRFLSYEFSLPYVDVADEVHLYWTAQALRGQYDPAYNRGYPPAFIVMNAATQIVLEARGQGGLAATVQVLRFLGVCANLVTIVLIGLSARLLAGDLAGWFAAAFWAASSLIVQYSVLAIGETFLYPLTALCIYLTIAAMLKTTRWYGCLLVVVPIFLFEYRYFVFLLPGILVVLWGVRRRFNLRVWIALGITAILIGAAAIAALYLLLPTYRGWLVQILTVNLWNFAGLRDYLGAAFAPFNLLLLIIVSVLGIMGWRKVRLSAETIWTLLICLATVFVICWVSSAVKWPGDQGVRDKEIIPAQLILVIIFAALFRQSLRMFPDRRLSVPYALAIGIAMFVPQITETVGFVNFSRLQNSRVLVREWADEDLPPGTVILAPENALTFNADWGGIPYRHWFSWWITKDFTQFSPQEWRKAGMTYMLLPLGVRNQMLQSDEGKQYLSQMLLLREFLPSSTVQGPTSAMYRLWRMDVPARTDFADGISLLGYDVLENQPHPGGDLQLRFYWQAASTPHDNYSLFVHLVPATGATPIAQFDGSPAVPERLTLTWTDPTETLISPAVTLNIPPEIAPGDYRVLIGLYDFQTLVRLPVAASASSQDSIELMRIHVS